MRRGDLDLSAELRASIQAETRKRISVSSFGFVCKSILRPRPPKSVERVHNEWTSLSVSASRICSVVERIVERLSICRSKLEDGKRVAERNEMGTLGTNLRKSFLGGLPHTTSIIA